MSYYSSHIEPDLNDEPHVYRGPDNADQRHDRGLHRPGCRRRDAALRRRLAPVHPDRPPPQELQRRADRDPRRRPPRGPRLADPYEVLEKYYDLAEELVGINGTRAEPDQAVHERATATSLRSRRTRSAQYAKDGMEELGRRLASGGRPPIQPYRTPLAVITRDHAPSGRKVPRDPKTGEIAPEVAKTSYVNRYGDPLGLKSSTWVRSCSARSRTSPTSRSAPNCIVTRLTNDGNKVNRVYYLDPGGTERSVEGKIVVVACSAVESIRLLKISAGLSPDFGERINGAGSWAITSSPTASAGRGAIMPGRFDKSKAPRRRLRHRRLRHRRVPQGSKALGRRCHLQQHVRPGPPPLALPHPRQHRPRHALGGVHACTAAGRLAGADAQGFIDLPRPRVRPGPLGQLHGQPGSPARPTASSCTRLFYCISGLTAI